MTQNRNEKQKAKAIQQHLNISYVHALRLLREGKYTVNHSMVVTEVKR